MNASNFDRDTLVKLFMGQIKGARPLTIARVFNRLQSGTIFNGCTKGMLAESWARARTGDSHYSGLNIPLNELSAKIAEQASVDEARRVRAAEHQQRGKELQARIAADREARQRKLDLHDELVNALHRISLASQNSMSSKDECGRIAREALAKVRS